MTLINQKLLFLDLHIRNFFSYGNVDTSVDLTRPGCTLIQGINMDNTADGTAANGTGKTTILTALIYLYTNEIPDDMLIGEIVNNVNGKDCVVGGSVMVDGDKYTIYKYRQSTEKPEKNYVEIFKNDDFTHNLAKGSLAEVTKQISTIIGIEPDIFKKIVLFDVNATPFLSEKGPIQRAIMEELFNINILMSKADQLSERMKDTKKLMTLAEADVNTQQRLYDDYSQRLVTTRQHLINWEQNHQNEIKRLEDELQQMLGSSIDFNLIQQCLEFNSNIESQVSTIVQQIQQLNNEISLNKSEMNRATSQISSFRSEIRSKHSLFDQYEQQIKQLNSNNDKLLANFCPECNQNVKSDHSTAKIETNNNKIKELHHQLDVINVDVYNIDCTIDECQDHFNRLQEHVSTLESQLIPLSRKIVELNSTKKPISISIKSVSDLDKIRDRETVLRTTIDVTRQKVNPYIEIVNEMESTPIPQPDRTTINELHDKYNHEQFLYKLMTDKKSFVRKHLIDKRLSILNAQIHSHLHDLGLPHTVVFNNDLTVTIARMGRKLPYGGLSSGQKARLNFAICLAFRDLLQISNRVVPFLMIDEVLDRALDDVGVQLATSAIHKIAKEQNCNVFLITHKSEIVNRFSKRIVVQFKDGFSTILPGDL